jgi:hypothetical protein
MRWSSQGVQAGHAVERGTAYNRKEQTREKYSKIALQITRDFGLRRGAQSHEKGESKGFTVGMDFPVGRQNSLGPARSTGIGFPYLTEK